MCSSQTIWSQACANFHESEKREISNYLSRWESESSDGKELAHNLQLEKFLPVEKMKLIVELILAAAREDTPFWQFKIRFRNFCRDSEMDLKLQGRVICNKTVYSDQIIGRAIADPDSWIKGLISSAYMVSSSDESIRPYPRESNPIEEGLRAWAQSSGKKRLSEEFFSMPSSPHLCWVTFQSPVFDRGRDFEPNEPFKFAFSECCDNELRAKYIRCCLGLAMLRNRKEDEEDIDVTADNIIDISNELDEDIDIADKDLWLLSYLRRCAEPIKAPTICDAEVYHFFAPPSSAEFYGHGTTRANKEIWRVMSANLMSRPEAVHGSVNFQEEMSVCLVKGK